MTGRIQNEFGFPHNSTDAGEGQNNLPRIYAKGTDKSWTALLTIAERMKELGYLTGISGKWHLSKGSSKKHSPQNRGFDYYWNGTMTSGLTNLSLDGKSIKPKPQKGLPNGVANRVILQVNMVNLSSISVRLKKKPFFLYLSLYGPHIPLINKKDPYYKNFPKLDYPHYDDWRDDRRRMGLALVKSIDDAVGGVVAKLREHGLEENTLVLFASDNGGSVKFGREWSWITWRRVR